MVVDPDQRRWHLFSALDRAVFAAVCLCIFSACAASSSQDQPINAGASVLVNTPVSSSGRDGVPISVVNARTSLVTYPGGLMTFAITTRPFAICNLLIAYGASVPSKAVGLIPHTADATGAVYWSWQVDLTAHTGNWPLTVSATLANGSNASAQLDTTVTVAPITVIASQSNLVGYPKQDMTLLFTTAPGVNCAILLDYGAGVPRKILMLRANQDGVAKLVWKVDHAAPPGLRPVTITVTLADGEQSSTSVNMTVLKTS